MNKKKIDEYIPNAYEALSESSLTTDGKMKKTYRGYVSSFGAAIIMGSVLAAVAYQQKDESRKELMNVIFEVLQKDEALKINGNNLFEYAKNNNGKKDVEENIYNAAIAVKLAMNQFELEDDKLSDKSEKR